MELSQLMSNMIHVTIVSFLLSFPTKRTLHARAPRSGVRLKRLKGASRTREVHGKEVGGVRGGKVRGGKFAA